ncbi:neutral amino acid transporter [Allomyces javanicus]|nr:neutral amino acid transporter [Allomyces javanicus]
MTAGPDVAPGSASALRVFILLLKSNIGTGALFLPGAFGEGGYAFSFVLLIVLAFLSTVGMVLLAQTNQLVPGSFEEMGKKLYGRWLHLLILGSVALAQSGFCSAYTVFIAQNTVEFVRRVSHDTILLKTWHIILIEMAFFIPCSWVRRVENFSAFSLMGNAFVLFGLGVICVSGISHMIDVGHVAEGIVQFNPDKFALYIGTAVYTYEGIGLVIPVSQSMKNPQRFPLVLSLALAVTTAVYLFVASCGYLAWGPDVKPIVLFNLPEGGFTSAIYILYIVAILLSWPLILFPATVIVERLLVPPPPLELEKGAKPVRGADWSPRKRYWVQNAVRMCLVLVIGGIAYAAGEALNKLVSIIGSFGCVPLSFVYPGLLHMRSHPEQGLMGRFTDWFLVVVGTVACLYVTVMTFMS